jgi:hypothetical protein
MYFPGYKIIGRVLYLYRRYESWRRRVEGLYGVYVGRVCEGCVERVCEGCVERGGREGGGREGGEGKYNKECGECRCESVSEYVQSN